MDVLVAGLGLIGGSMCMALKRAGHRVYGLNRSPEPLSYALKNGIIDAAANSAADYDVVFIALPPKATVDFMNSHTFKNGATVSDICGVKEYILKEVSARPRNFFYVGCHPMAGREVSGIENATCNLFDGANMVITRDSTTDDGAVKIIEKLTADMGFKRIVCCSAAVHDKKIAYTSQLAHVLSNAYARDGELEGCLGFTGGSFQDMTRIACVDQRVWSSLYILNGKNLSEKIQNVIDSLQKIKSALENPGEEELFKELNAGAETYKKNKLAPVPGEISVTELK